MIVKKLSKQNLDDVYTSLQKNRRKIKKRSLLFAIFAFGVNAFAWFVFISKANVSINTNVVSWDVNFSDSSEVISNVVIETPDLYPGMPTYKKEIYITNSSDLGGTFTYTINSIKVFGDEVMTDTTTQDGAITYLKETFPFVVSFSTSKTDLAEKDNMIFTISIDWPQESTDPLARTYYRLTKHYTYDPSVIYYNLTSGIYNKVENVTEEIFEVNKTGYFLEKDDVDSFWGASCKNYRDTNGQACFNFKLLLKVTQKVA